MSVEKKPGSQMRMTDAEVSLIKNTFGGKEDLLLLMRKIFLPEISADVPLGQNIDLWMTIPIDNLPVEQAIINLKARNTVITHIDQMLNVLKILSEGKEETPEQAVARLRKDSSK